MNPQQYSTTFAKIYNLQNLIKSQRYQASACN